MNTKSIRNNLFTLGLGAIGLLGASQSFAASGEYTGHEYWELGTSKSWGNAWAGGSYSYLNTADAAHDGNSVAGAGQSTVTRTEMTVKAKVTKKTIVLLQAMANGEARSYHSEYSEFYRARGSLILLGKEFLNANYYDYGSGAAAVAYTQILEKSVEKEASFYGVPVKGKFTGTLSGTITANGSRQDATADNDGNERATSSLGISAKATGKVSVPGASVSVKFVEFSVTPNAYSYRDADPDRSASDRIRYRIGIDSPLSVSAGGGKLEVLSKTVFSWKDWSSSKSYGKHDHDERFASSWY